MAFLPHFALAAILTAFLPHFALAAMAGAFPLRSIPPLAAFVPLARNSSAAVPPV